MTRWAWPPGMICLLDPCHARQRSGMQRMALSMHNLLQMHSQARPTKSLSAGLLNSR